MTGRLRIVAGEFGGRLISCPGSVARPTTDRVREAVFSAILSARGGLEGCTVCDAFAGSGALGFEALSRGAASLQLFDADGGALSCVKRNAQVLGVQSRAQAARRDVLAAGINGAGAPYGLVLLDPPYATDAARVAALLERAGAAGDLEEGCLVVYERAATAPALSALPGFRLLKEKRYGKTTVAFLLFEDPSGALAPCQMASEC